MTPEYRKRATLALLTATVGGGLIAYGWGGRSSEDAPPITSSLSSRSLTSYVTQKADDGGASGLYGMEPLKVQDGALSWDLFGEVQSLTKEEVTSVGAFPNAMTLVIQPVFTEAMQQYNGQKVKIMGYMFPLEEGVEQKHFLIGPYPPSCVLHYHAPNNQVIEVKSNTPIPLTWEPILVEGTLTLLPSDPNNSFYRLENTRFIKEYPQQ
ncbi:MAG: DUF3299 domain-containing protein [Alphaproteobacteria bacterium]